MNQTDIVCPMWSSFINEHAVFELAGFELSELLSVLIVRHFVLLSAHLPGQWCIEWDCIPFFNLADIEVVHFLSLETRVVTILKSVLVFKGQLFVRLNMVYSIDLFIKVECQWLLVRQIDVLIVHALRLTQSERVLLRPDRLIQLALSLTIVSERRWIAHSLDVVGDHGDVETLALEAAFLVSRCLLRSDADRLVWYQRRLTVVSIETDLHFTCFVTCLRDHTSQWLLLLLSRRDTVFDRDSHIVRDQSVRVLWTCHLHDAATLDHVQTFSCIFDLALKPENLLIQMGATRLAWRDTLSTFFICAFDRLLEVMHSVNTSIVGKNLQSKMTVD